MVQDENGFSFRTAIISNPTNQWIELRSRMPSELIPPLTFGRQVPLVDTSLVDFGFVTASPPLPPGYTAQPVIAGQFATLTFTEARLAQTPGINQPGGAQVPPSQRIGKITQTGTPTTIKLPTGTRSVYIAWGISNPAWSGLCTVTGSSGTAYGAVPITAPARFAVIPVFSTDDTSLTFTMSQVVGPIYDILVGAVFDELAVRVSANTEDHFNVDVATLPLGVLNGLGGQLVVGLGTVPPAVVGASAGAVGNLQTRPFLIAQSGNLVAAAAGQSVYIDEINVTPSDGAGGGICKFQDTAGNDLCWFRNLVQVGHRLAPRLRLASAAGTGIQIAGSVAGWNYTGTMTYVQI